MAEHIILFCNLEHLPPHDVEGTGGSPGKWAFGLNLAIGINDQIPGLSLEAMKPFMQPWTWPQIIQVKVRVRDGVSGRTTTETIPAVKWKGETIDCTHCRDERTQLNAGLDEEYERSRRIGFDAFKWQPDGVLSKTSKISTRPWHTFVGQLSTNPPPFPQCLNLSFIFYVDKLTTAGPKSVFAAPLLPKTSTCGDLSLPWTTKIVPKGDAPQEWPGRTGIFQWEYETDAGGTPSQPLIAHMAECPVWLSAPPPATFLDLGSQWVGKLPGGEDLFEEDWRPMVEERMADGLDFPQRIIEYLRKHLDNTTIIPQLKLFQWAAIAGLRDLAGAGIFLGPDKRRFIDFALRTVDKDFAGIEAHVSAIETRIKEKFGTLNDWLLFLSANLPEVSNISVLSLPRAFNDAGVPKVQVVVPEEQATVASVVAELEQLHKAVLDPKNLIVLLRQQWRELLKGILSNDEMALIEKVDLDSLNVRHYLALENLGDLWTIFIKMPSTDGFGHDIIRKNFSCLFQEYFCKRFDLSLTGLTADVGGAQLACDITQIQSGLYRKRQPEILTTFKKDDGTIVRLGFPLTDIRDVMVDYIKSWSKDFSQTLLPPRVVEPTTVPHAITMQVDGLAGMVEESADPVKQDILRRISGIGILMRKAGADWRCLNLASAYRDPHMPAIADPVLVPSRLNYRNELRQAFISYNNHPVTAESPVADEAMSKVRLRLPNEAELTPEQRRQVDAPPLLRFKYSNVVAARRLPGLEFGQTFEILPFMVANCGALPTALLADDPSRKSPIEAALENFNVTKLNATDRNKIRTVSYLRKVRVGGIRVFDDTGNVSLKMPSIPDTVAPRARDIDKTAMASANSVWQRDPAEHAMLLLAPKEWEDQNTGALAHFGFCIRKPATDLNTWDRWIASSLAADRRASVWADFYRQSETKRTSAKPTQGTEKFQLEDTSIDDPATLNQFFFELWVIDGASSTPLKTEWVVIGGPPLPPDKLGSVQANFTHVTCTLGTTETIDASGLIEVRKKLVKDVKITVKKGQVYQLNVFTCVSKTDYERRFANVIPAMRETTDSTGASVFLVSPFSMLIETATEVMIEGIEGRDAIAKAEQRLWERLKPGFAPADHPGAIAFNVTPTDPATDEGFKFLHRAELLRQVWRWQGRETPLHPCLRATSSCKQNGVCTNLDGCAEMDEWEAWEFGNRFETDHLIQDMTTQPPTKLGGRKFFYKEVLETGSADTDELRALHYRFAIKVYSRYAGIMPANVPSEKFPNVTPSLMSKARIPLSANEVKETNWRRLFIPCRRKKELPVPKVKLILPLTESFGDEIGNTAGLLLVLNEPWYQEAGLGEGIAAEVQMTAAPENNPNGQGDKDTLYFELGTDPVVELAERGYRQSKDPANEFFDEVCLNQKIRGPVGHTFDRTNESPLFVATSFIIPAPAIFSTRKGGSKEQIFPDFSWSFCRLRLRRTVTLSKDGAARTDCRLTTPAAQVTNCDQPSASSQITGPFTDPYWVQYLPEFSHFAPADMKLSDARLRLEKPSPGSVQVSIVDRGGQKILLLPDKNLNHIFELYLVLTRRVFDVAGRPDQEVYLEVFHQIADNLWETNGALPLSSDAGLRARIIEVQRRPSQPPAPPLQPFASGEPLWLALFGPRAGVEDKTPDKDLARIVRISQPIESLSAGPNDC